MCVHLLVCGCLSTPDVAAHPLTPSLLPLTYRPATSIQLGHPESLQSGTGVGPGLLQLQLGGARIQASPGRDGPLGALICFCSPGHTGV